MIKINKKTLQKSEEIKQMISTGVDLQEIIKLKFSRNKKNKNEWIIKNKNMFNNEELQYLEVDISEETSENKLDLILNLLEKQNEFIFSTQNKAINNQDKLNIPVDYYRLTNLKQQGLRINEKTYKKFIRFAKNNNYPIMTLINYILDDFLNKFDKN